VNVQLRPKPFQKRKPSPIAAQATGSAETFVRYVATKAAGLLGQDEGKFASIKWPADRRLHGVIRASAEPPTDLSNTPALAVMGTDFVESLQPISAAARLFRASRLMLNFDRLGAITVPDLFGIDEGPPAWVESGQPAPVGELTANATILQPFKLEFIVTVTREMILGSNAERLLGDALRSKIAFDLDKTLFDALPESAARPAGLRSYNLRLPASNWTSGNDNAMLQDVGTLIRAAEAIAGGEDFYLIARSQRIAAMRQLYHGQVPPNLVLLPSAASLALPDSVLLCVVPRAVPSAIGLPEIELVESAAVEMDDAPASPDFSTAQNVRSFFQTDTLGLKVRLPASWGLRHPAGANWITCLWPADMGAGTGGGIPDAPADEFTYGRHQGAWEQVVEDAPATPPATGFVRTNVSTSPWVPIDNLLAPYAPLISPIFGGAPRAPHPPAADASDRIATTQFVADNASAGVEEVPAAPNGAYARSRAGANATWVDFVTLGVAPTFSPQFTGNPTAPTPASTDAPSDRLATTQYVRDNAPAGGVEEVPATPPGTAYARFRIGAGAAGWSSFDTLRVASLDDPVFAGGITVPNGGPNNPGIKFTDPSCGFYRAGNLMVLMADGTGVAQFGTTLCAIFENLFMNNNRIALVGDPTADTDALNRRTADGRYIGVAGGTLTGTLIAKPGTGINDLGIGLGDNQTGFYRLGNALTVMSAGFSLTSFDGDARTVLMAAPLSMGAQRITALANPTTGTDALNMQSGDARYLTLQNGGIVVGAVQFLFNPVLPTDAVTKGYVDGQRARPVVFDIPADVPIPGNGAWTDIARVPFTIPLRPGLVSLVMISVNCNLRGVNNVNGIGVRVPTAQEQRVFGFGRDAASDSAGLSVNIYAQPAAGATTLELPVQMNAFDVGGTIGPYTVVGGGPTGSQITVIDLGPIS
jgi:hypothetical protein